MLARIGFCHSSVLDLVLKGLKMNFLLLLLASAITAILHQVESKKTQMQKLKKKVNKLTSALHEIEDNQQVIF